jgi:CelD/BcsL family acetyltransferase involved in cellulose biosynthesis
LVASVERRSWKAAARQSMLDLPSQGGLYRRLLEEGLCETQFLMDGDRPVAYRLDGRAGHRVVSLKWSFAEEYGRDSPGFYLLTEGLIRRWSTEDVSEIDLNGSPDHMKEAICTSMSARVDITFPEGPECDALRVDRQRHDGRVAAAYDNGSGLRTLYLPN